MSKVADEFKTISWHRYLVDRGYKIVTKHDRWSIQEPNTVNKPQTFAGLESIGECVTVAHTCEQFRRTFKCLTND